MLGTLAALLALAAFLGASCKKSGGEGAAGAGAGGKGGPAAGPQVFAVTTVPATAGQISDYLSLSGNIIAGSSVDAYSDASGKITRVFVSVGARVVTGQAIANVDPSKPGMQFVQHTVRSPISGIVTALPAEVGKTISTAVPLATIAGGSALEIQLFVPERYISRVRLGLACEITLDAYPDEIFRGTINEVSPTVDPASRTMAIKVNVDNQRSLLKAGMFAKVKIITESRSNAICVPVSAIVKRQDKTVVFIERNESEGDTVRQTEVTTGIIADGIAEITSGVSEGDNVVDKGMTLLSDGARVNVIQRGGTQQ
jgi:multidrug efflux pump subunit AcrA (membrane-fusion protein)